MKIRHVGMSAHPGGLTKLNVVVDGDRSEIADLVMKANEDPDDKPWILKIEKLKKKRSLDANAYYWVLIGKLAQQLHASNEEIHAIMLDRYGNLRERDDGSLVTFTIRSDIDPKEVTPYSRAMRTGERDGKSFTVYAVLKGSSEMDTSEFSALLEGVIGECREQNIETLPPEEVERLKAMLGERKWTDTSS